MRRTNKLASLVMGCAALCAWAEETNFRVAGIEARGLNRISEETFYNYLPFQIGDTYDQTVGDRILNQLYATQFFQNIKLERDGDRLIVLLTERPVIAEVRMHGLKNIKEEDMRDALKSIGVTKGRALDPMMAENIQYELERLYHIQGRYAASVAVSFEQQEAGRAIVSIRVHEGDVAKIKNIMWVGNRHYNDEELKKQFQLTTPSWWTWFTKNDRYSKQRLEADLEHLRGFYLDRGYLNVAIKNAQVALAPDRRDVYLTIGLDEGFRYQINSMSLHGESAVPRDELLQALEYKVGELFSRERVSQILQKLNAILGNHGYAYAQVEPVPVIDEANHTLALEFHMRPGERYQVRDIVFHGNQRTHDTILRQDTQQLEGTWLSLAQVERSKEQLTRSGFIDEVQFELRPVQDTPDQLDLIFHVVESSSVTFSAEAGYGRPDGLSLQFSFANRNFLGMGRLLDLHVSHTKAYANYDLTYNNPYYALSGITRGFNAYHSKSKPGRISDVADYLIDATGGNVNYAFPIAALDHFHVSTGVRHTKLMTGRQVSDQIQEFIDERNRHDYVELNTTVGWEYNSLNRFLFATKGMRQTFNVMMSFPGSHLQYYRAHYNGYWVKPISADLLWMTRASSGYGDGYGNTQSLPFFKNFFMGGSRTVRGFSENSIGPKDSLGRPFGGNFMLNGSVMMAFPKLMGSRSKEMRPGVFFDIGQVYQVGSKRFTQDHVPLPNNNPTGLRHSVGAALTWMTPMGLLEFSWAQPLKKRSGDHVEKFAFSMGTSFY